MKQVSLANISYAQGLQLLALRKEALDSGSAEKLPVEVLRDSYPLRDIGRSYSEKLGFDYKALLADPAVKSTLIGGGLGAAVGAGKSYLSGDDEEKEHLGRNMLMGGLGGAALGGAAGLYANPKSLDKLVTPATNVITKSTPTSSSLDPTEANKAVAEFADLSDKANTLIPEAEAAILTGGATALTGKGIKELASPLPDPNADTTSLQRVIREEFNSREKHKAEYDQILDNWHQDSLNRQNDPDTYAKPGPRPEKPEYKMKDNRSQFFTEAKLDPQDLSAYQTEKQVVDYLDSIDMPADKRRQFAEAMSGLTNTGTNAFEDYGGSKGGARILKDMKNITKNPKRALRLIRGGGLTAAGAGTGIYALSRYLKQRNQRNAASRSLEEIRKKLGL